VSEPSSSSGRGRRRPGPSTENGAGDRRTRLEHTRQRSIRRQLAVTAMAAMCGAACLGFALSLDGTQAVAAPTPAAERVVTPILSVRRTPELLARPLADRRLKAAVTAISTQSPATHCIAVHPRGVAVVEDNSTAPLTPASNMKVVTGAVALEVLGADSRFTTRVIANSEPLNGVIDGPLYLVGGGDPLLETDNYDRGLKYPDQPHTRLEALADQVQAAGVTKVTGGILGDDDRLDQARSVATWPDRYMNDGEVGPLTALSVNDARVVPGGSQLAGIAGASSTTPSTDPPAHAAVVFAEVLRARGIVVDGETKAGPAPTSGQQIAAVDSLTVAEIVGQMLRFSDNNTAELLLKEVGLKAKKDPTTPGGAAVVLDTLAKWGFNTEGVVVADGSGLDQTNKVTCDLLVQILERGGPLGPLAAGLAVPQQNGTLRDRYEDSPAIDNVRAKTGTLSGVTSLSGWVASDIGSHIAFSYLMNMADRPVDQQDLERQELLTELLTLYPDLPPMDQLEPLPADPGTPQ
jgi:D-alanyl-D-alanine carboxypeptidase/D-alanyl-D-alanine-endopeptidase (penicillin-binding protein 4)